MEAKYTPFNFTESRARMDEILEAADASYEEVQTVPPRDRLTFTNGFYANCAALFVDIRGSSQLGQQHNRPTLAKDLPRVHFGTRSRLEE